VSAELRLEANYLALRAIGPWLESLLLGHCVDQLGTIELGVHELATNSVDHAQSRDGILTLRGTVEAGCLRIVMHDRGIEFDAARVATPHPDRPQVRGYGLMILEQLVEELVYERQGEFNVWNACFALDDTQ